MVAGLPRDELESRFHVKQAVNPVGKERQSASLLADTEATKYLIENVLDIHPPCQPPERRRGMAQILGPEFRLIRWSGQECEERLVATLELLAMPRFGQDGVVDRADPGVRAGGDQ